MRDFHSQPTKSIWIADSTAKELKEKKRKGRQSQKAKNFFTTFGSYIAEIVLTPLRQRHARVLKSLNQVHPICERREENSTCELDDKNREEQDRGANQGDGNLLPQANMNSP